MLMAKISHFLQGLPFLDIKVIMLCHCKWRALIYTTGWYHWLTHWAGQMQLLVWIQISLLSDFSPKLLLPPKQLPPPSFLIQTISNLCKVPAHTLSLFVSFSLFRVLHLFVFVFNSSNFIHLYILLDVSK